MTDRASPHEITLSAAWHAELIARDLETTDGQSVQVIHRGTWSHGLGPDFADALLLFNGRELRAGSVEVHLHTRGWRDHGHHLDPRYGQVILHIVGQHDGRETRRLDGAIIPVVAVGPPSAYPSPDFTTWEWDRVGGEVCAAQSVATNAAGLRGILLSLGDLRLATRVARVEARLQSEPPAEVLWQDLLDGFGFSRNREPMRAVGLALPIAALEDVMRLSPGLSLATARGALLGVGGFLPLSPAESPTNALTSEEIVALESAWRGRGTPFHENQLRPSAWQLARVRPTNHPVVRLISAANMVAASLARGGLLATLLEQLTSNDPVRGFQVLTTSRSTGGIGLDRAIDMLASSVIPFALALAELSGDESLADAAARLWERLPAPTPNEITRRAARQLAGGAPIGKIGARGAQGLIQLDTTLCRPRRCFECPIAAFELAVNADGPPCQRPKSTP